MKRILPILPFVLAWLILAGCRSTRHVPQGKMLLDKVGIEVMDSNADVKAEDMVKYVQQLPNHKILWLVKLQLGIYNMSGKDSTKWYNRLARKMGEAPVIYDPSLTGMSVSQLRGALVNKGYLHARVVADTFVNVRGDKMRVNYGLYPGEPYVIRSIDYQFPSDSLRREVMRDSLRFPVKPGDPLDRDMLETERTIITDYLNNRGYYAFSKDLISFNADTTAGSREVDLTLKVNPPYPARRVAADSDKVAVAVDSHSKYIVRNIYCVTDYNAVRMMDLDFSSSPDTLDYKDMRIFYGKDRYIRPSVLYDNCFIRKGSLYSSRDVDRTYEAFSRLGILKFVNIRTVPVASLPGYGAVDVYILLTPGKLQTISFEVEGTNSEGDLGVAATATYTHRNIGKGSETFSVKLRGAYESLSGNLSGLLHDRYMEYSLETSVSFPKFKFPFLRESFKRKIRASTDLSISMNYQERPEYTRVIANAGWGYKWTERNNRRRHVFTIVDVDYVYLPESTNDFINEIAPGNPLLRYSYEDHFIMRMGYSFYLTNKRQPRYGIEPFQSDIFTLRVNAETAGNVLCLASRIFSGHRDLPENPYRIFGIRYSQYVKAEADYALTHIFDERSSLAFHAGLGVAYPYGNANILPFEKRFYGGGANGVRGWDVRTLGPGSFNGSNSVASFINQCGDIRLDLNLEYRAKLFWLLEGAVFLDAGNIWTIHNYANQPGGMFKFNRFYKQIAAAYGIGLRLDFTYFLIRFDMGMKAHNPAMGQEPWPLLHPKWGRDSSFHFSIGYPF